MQSRQTIHLPSGSASNQVQPAPEQVAHRSFSAIARSLCVIGQAYIAPKAGNGAAVAQTNSARLGQIRASAQLAHSGERA
jgi:hypothetical protein